MLLLHEVLRDCTFLPSHIGREAMMGGQFAVGRTKDNLASVTRLGH